MYGVFKELVMENGEFRYDLKSQPVSTSIVQDIGGEFGHWFRQLFFQQPPHATARLVGK